MDRSSRSIILSGLALATLSLIFGIIFSYWVDHKARLAEYDDYRTTLELIVDAEPAVQWRKELEDTNRHSALHRRASVFHTHAINMGILLILVGLYLPLLKDSRESSPWLAWSFVGFAWLYPMGLLLQLSGFILTGQVIAATGALLAITTLGLLYRKLSRALDSLLT